MNDATLPGDWRGSYVERSEYSLPHATRCDVLRSVARAIRDGLTVVEIDYVSPTGSPSSDWIRIVAEHRGNDRAVNRAAARGALALLGWTSELMARGVH
jgi:hypothetical protein